jgi:integrase
LVFAILTAGRSGEVRNLTADQLGLDNALWSVPAERMKTGKPHSVPLSKLAIKFAKKGLSLNREAVFPNRSGRALSNAALLECLKGITTGATVHGWRSTFMGWATKEGYSRELTEKALAHQEPNQVRRAYQRNNLLEERRPMMKAWERYLLSSK